MSQLSLLKTPQIYQYFDSQARIIVLFGDTLDLLSSIPSSIAKLIVTSPPYNIGKEYESKTSIQNYFSKQDKIIDELVRILDDEGSICWQVGNYVDNGEVYPLDIYYYDIFKRRGLKLRNRIIWHFGHGLHASKRFSGRYETILWFTKSDSYTFNLDSVRIPVKYPGKRHYKGINKGKPSSNPKGKNPSDIWEYVQSEWENELWNIPNVKSNHPEKTIHPCQYPVELVERCALALTNEDDWILDPFCGVGSSLIAGIKNNRRVIGCDKEHKYIEITKKRIESFYDGSLKLRPMGKEVFVPTGREKVSQIPKEWKLNNTEED
jgi:DNA modification methylase